MSPNRGAAIQAITNQNENTRSMFDIINENVQREADESIIADLLRYANVSNWDASGCTIVVPDVYQLDTGMVEASKTVLPGCWGFCVAE